ncbi:phosphotransferase [Wenzhouxiangella sp. XN79A]|uniref:aminoglycoside phosphotransferase family protein n=1 Tax=Wenzhouxiangella sp. XN79A TaxID=2724193 RepID=UPI00144ABE64|nr:phosphotransferase [Wenzhouxiangella sp. XN79A]NKI34655.1 phosphotransferase [Wenzhouxiangella sp. XN79A]
MTKQPTDPDARERAARAFAEAALGRPAASWAPASADASFRRYFRIIADGHSFVVMDAPPEREALAPFVDIAARLAAAGLEVPAIEAQDREHGYLLLGDLGRLPYHHRLDADNADALFADALNALIRMQCRAAIDGLPEYDAALLLRELALFPDWFLARHWQVEASDAELDDWELVCMTLIRWALDQPQVFCHRDFMPRNLMVVDPPGDNPGILDFQDAVVGPISYDPVCLFRDAFLSWPEQRVLGWLEQYRRDAADAGLPVPADAELWRRTCDLMGVQRHLKVLGIFARIRYRDGKPHYLDDAPRFFGYLAHAIARNPELAVLDRLLQAWRARAVVA